VVSDIKRKSELIFFILSSDFRTHTHCGNREKRKLIPNRGGCVNASLTVVTMRLRTTQVGADKSWGRKHERRTEGFLANKSRVRQKSGPKAQQGYDRNRRGIGIRLNTEGIGKMVKGKNGGQESEREWRIRISLYKVKSESDRANKSLPRQREGAKPTIVG